MNVTVVEAHGLPGKAFLSIRAGDVKRMRPFRGNESYNFDKGSERCGHLQLDVFEQLGSQVVHGLMSHEDLLSGNADASKEVFRHVHIPTRGGREVSAQLKLSLSDFTSKETAKIEKEYARQQLAADAKQYLDICSAWSAVQNMLHALVRARPEDPILYMIQYLVDLRRSSGSTDLPENLLQGMSAPAASSATDDAAAAADTTGAPTAEAAPADSVAAADVPVVDAAEEAPAVSPRQNSKTGIVLVPDLSDHHSAMATILQKNVSIYAALRNRSTSLGFTFHSCIRPGLDFRGHPGLKVVGAVAGDEECYDVFSQLFNAIVHEWHGGYDPLSSYQTTELSDFDVSTRLIDPSKKYVIATRLRGVRNISGIRFPSSCTDEERRQVEELLAEALVHQEDKDVVFEYFPLKGSSSFGPKPGGMKNKEEQALADNHLLFKEPADTYQVSSGLARRWPDARGVFSTKSRSEVVWCNESDHIRVFTLDLGADVQGAFRRYCEIVKQIERSLHGQEREFAFHQNLGYLSTCPSNLGTGLRISVMMNLPHLVSLPVFPVICRALDLSATATPDESGGIRCPVEVVNATCIGISETEIVNKVIDDCTTLIELEQRLERAPQQGLPSHPATPNVDKSNLLSLSQLSSGPSGRIDAR